MKSVTDFWMYSELFAVFKMRKMVQYLLESSGHFSYNLDTKT